MEIGIIKAFLSYPNFAGYTGDDPTTEEEYLALQPVEGRLVGNQTEPAVWDGVAPTWEEVQAKLAELQSAEDAKDAAKAAGNQKLLDLGLTQEEATALTGYTPPAE
jgi:hypothetical protein